MHEVGSFMGTERNAWWENYGTPFPEAMLAGNKQAFSCTYKSYALVADSELESANHYLLPNLLFLSKNKDEKAILFNT